VLLLFHLLTKPLLHPLHLKLHLALYESLLHLLLLLLLLLVLLLHHLHQHHWYHRYRWCWCSTVGLIRRGWWGQLVNWLDNRVYQSFCLTKKTLSSF
jgi:hypothetical protein